MKCELQASNLTRSVNVYPLETQHFNKTDPLASVRAVRITMGTKRKCLVLSDRHPRVQAVQVHKGLGGPSVPRSHTDSPALGLSPTLTHGAHSTLKVYTKAPGKPTTPIPGTGEGRVMPWMPGFL